MRIKNRKIKKKSESSNDDRLIKTLKPHRLKDKISLKITHISILEFQFLSSTYNDDVYLKKVTTRVSQNLIPHKKEDQPKA
jgi:hypothetical protein